MERPTVPGALVLACLLLTGSACAGQKTPGRSPLQQALLGRWETPGQETALALSFAAGGTVTISLRVGGRWHESKATYKVLSPSTLELVLPFHVFPEEPLRRTCAVVATPDRLRLAIRGGPKMTLERRR